jgi:glycine C-acetyltransferase
MPLERLHKVLSTELAELKEKGTFKGEEDVIVEVLSPERDQGPRYRLEEKGDREFIKMNSNAYLGMSMHPEVIRAQEEAARRYGVGPGAVRFTSGTYGPHAELERRLAAFHGRETAMIYSSAYAAILSVLDALITADTIVIGDQLNHHCITDATRLARPRDRKSYRHLAMDELRGTLTEAVGSFERAIIVTDGIFSMRGDHAPLDVIAATGREFNSRFPEGVVLVVDDSHGMGAFGKTGRGTEEFTGATGVDLLVATLGKALGVNGGYVATSRVVAEYLREKAIMYIHSNPIAPSEAAAALKALEILDSPRGLELLDELRRMTRRFREGLVRLGYETLPGEHPMVPLMVRDTGKTRDLVQHLKHRGVLATGLAYPVVPRGDEEIRFQISADHTEADIDIVLDILEMYRSRR